MILTVDVGNTVIVLGAFDGNNLRFVSRVATEIQKTDDQYAIQLSDILSLYHCDTLSFEGAIISCVVPPLSLPIKKSIYKLLGCPVSTVSYKNAAGLDIKIDNPAILGTDMICSAVSAKRKYGTPSIVIDLGTATKISAIGKDGSFLGCSIMPGVGISLNALSSGTAQLPHIGFDDVEKVIGTNTVDSMKSGIIYGTASMLDGMIGRYKAILDENAKAIATGGFSGVIAPYCESKLIYDPNLVLEGLYEIYRNERGI
ncbi:MAG: type III pantothenate kinase [Clostridiales bacterium]|nr:type III pantothenate kinase [Clostridiales bacterium]